MSNQELIREIKAHVATLMTDLAFHNIEHTIEVVEEVKKIGLAEGLSEEELFLTEISAWFHDTGYNQNESCEGNHEDKSIEIAQLFLADHLSNKQIEIPHL